MLVVALGAAGCTGDEEPDEGEGPATSERPPDSQDEEPPEETPPDPVDGGRAPWDADAVPPPADLAGAVEELLRPGSPSFGMPCALYAPTRLGAEGLIPEPASGLRVGRQLPLQWRAPDGDVTVTVNVWIQDNVEVLEYYGADPDGSTFADGSVVRRVDDDLMFTVPGEGCFYEVVFENAAEPLRELAFTSIREIDY